MISWEEFLLGEAELACETKEDAELLLQICCENGVDCSYVNPDDYYNEPFWYIEDNSLYTTRYTCDGWSICSTWTVSEYIKEHTY